MPPLRDPVIRRIEHLNGFYHVVPSPFDSPQERLQEIFRISERQAFNILKDEIPGFQLSDQPGKMKEQLIPRVGEQSLSDFREPLARRPAEDHIDPFLAELGFPSQLVSGRFGEVELKCRTCREVLIIGFDVVQFDVEGGDDIEARLLEAKGHSPDSGEQVNSDGTLFDLHDRPL
jgi:hypothetical protein